MTQFDFMMDLEPRVIEEINPLGQIRYSVQWVSISGAHLPEPCSFEFKSRRKAERFAAKRQLARLKRTYRSVT